MSTFRSCLSSISGLKFIYEDLQFQSSIGRNKLLNQPFMTDPVLLQKELDLLEEVIVFIRQDENFPVIEAINIDLQQINDIGNTIVNIGNKQVLDDIELFEIKKFSISVQHIAEKLKASDFNILQFYDLNPVIRILDPDDTKIPHFYIYSSYSPELNTIRKKMASTTDSEELEAYRWESCRIEDRIREKLSTQLSSYQVSLQQNLERIATLDLLLSKAFQVLRLQLSKPQIVSNKTTYRGLFNPEIKSIMDASSRKFQPVDIELYPAPCLITGANMSGKTVLLQTLALVQYLFQFGFYVPALQSAIIPVDEVMISIGDYHSETNGLSSFAGEICKIDQIIRKAKQGKKLLVLIDELARTTNPEEGKALVSAFIQIMAKYNTISLITSHYSGISTSCRKLRVKGLVFDAISKSISPETINDYMDYSLVEINDDEVPMEALKIAEIFNVDTEFLQIAKQYTTKE